MELIVLNIGLDLGVISPTLFAMHLVLMPLWLAQTPELDLVTFCFGGNDWEAGMRGEQFAETCKDAVDRIRRATHGKADVLILTTDPSVARWRTMTELTEACRAAAQDRKAGLADTDKAFVAAGGEGKERLFAEDKTHLSAAGQGVMAQTVVEAIESGK